MATVDHTDNGYVEKIISSARHRISLGMSDEDVQNDLVSKGVSPDQAYFAIAAAKILLKDVE